VRGWKLGQWRRDGDVDLDHEQQRRWRLGWLGWCLVDEQLVQHEHEHEHEHEYEHEHE